MGGAVATGCVLLVVIELLLVAALRQIHLYVHSNDDFVEAFFQRLHTRTHAHTHSTHAHTHTQTRHAHTHHTHSHIHIHRHTPLNPSLGWLPS
jgi:hypothetical protein